MGVKRIVDVGFWLDDKIENFNPQEKLFILYLLTNPHSTQLGIYPITKRLIAFETGYSIGEIETLIKKFEDEYHMIKYSEETKEIAIRNYLKYSIFSGGKPVEDLLLKEIKQVKDKELVNYVFSNLQDYEELNATVKKIINNIYSIDNIHNINNIYNNQKQIHNQKQKQKQKQKSYPLSYHDTYHESYNDTCSLIIDYLNELAGTNFRASSKKNQDLIKALLKDYSVDEIKTVIDKMCYLWNREPEKDGKDMRIYLRPSTLFRKSNFENYLGMNVPTRKLTTADLAKKMDFSEFSEVDWE